MQCLKAVWKRDAPLVPEFTRKSMMPATPCVLAAVEHSSGCSIVIYLAIAIGVEKEVGWDGTGCNTIKNENLPSEMLGW